MQDSYTFEDTRYSQVVCWPFSVSVCWLYAVYTPSYPCDFICNLSILHLSLLQQPLLLKIFGDNHHRLLHTRLLAVDMNLRILGRLVRRTDPRELLDLAGLGLFVEALGIALLRLLDGDVDEDFDEGQ